MEELDDTIPLVCLCKVWGVKWRVLTSTWGPQAPGSTSSSLPTASAPQLNSSSQRERDSGAQQRPSLEEAPFNAANVSPGLQDGLKDVNWVQLQIIWTKKTGENKAKDTEHGL